MSIRSSNSYPYSQPESLITTALCVVVLAAGALVQFMGVRWGYFENSVPFCLPLAAAGLSVLGVIRLNDRPQWLRVQRWLLWCGLLLMVWLANGLPFDLLRISGLIPLPVDWSEMVIRILAITAAVLLARLALKRSPANAQSSPGAWYGYVAFLFALPYPILRIIWALGGTPGLTQPGAAGTGFTPLLAAVPWMLAAILSLMLIPLWRRIPRRLLLIAGWSATTIVAMIAPAACWSLIKPLTGSESGLDGIALWVPCLFYGSWLLWTIAAGAATRSYQLRTVTISKY